jgi:hypothetical protein
MSGLGAGPVQKTSLESSLKIKYVHHFWEFWLEDSF